MPKRLAITIAGAVSLGSYEAGVLYEVFRALAQHNVNDPHNAIIVDVITGASAGGMSATIAAQKLLFQADALKDPYDNHFYNPWVRDIDLSLMLKLDPGENSQLSLFSSNLINRIAEKYLLKTDGDGQAPQPPYKAHPAVGKSVQLGLALSNLSGVGYKYPVLTGGKGKGEFEYTRFQDRKIGTIAADDKTGGPLVSDKWEDWKEAAVSCGAFPFAFRVKDLARYKREYTSKGRHGSHTLDPASFPEDPMTFCFTDGGLFQNEPLGMAKEIVDGIDNHEDNDNRFYLFVAPGTRGGSPNCIKESDSNFLVTAQAIVGSVLNQAKFQDWIDAEAVNTQINLFRTRADQLREVLQQDPKLAETMGPAAKALLAKFFPGLETNEHYQKGLLLIKNRLEKDYRGLTGLGADVQDAYLNAALLLRTAADLNDQDRMWIYGITATDKELQGHQLFAFKGFFDMAIRHHDYNVGRKKAREFLEKVGHSGNQPSLGPLKADFSGPILELKDMSEPHPQPVADPKKVLVDAVMLRSDGLLDDLKVPWFCKGIVKLFVRAKLQEFIDKQLAPDPTTASSDRLA